MRRKRGAGREAVKACTRREWQAILRDFRAAIPPPEGKEWRFKLTRKLADGQLGECSRTLKFVTLTVLQGLSVSETEDTLIHEAAHGFDRWDHHGWAGDHSDTFFLWYGRIYRKYHGIN